MRRGDWLVTHQGIAFDTRGVLVDGQHRLGAVVEADVTVKIAVFTDVEPDTFDVLDTREEAQRRQRAGDRGGEVRDSSRSHGAHRVAVREPARVDVVGGLPPA